MLDEGRGTFRGGDRLAYGLAAALLADLVQLERITIAKDVIGLIDGERTGHALLDEYLARISASPQRSPERFIAAWSRDGLAQRVTDRLITAGTLTTRVDRGLGIFSVRRYTIVPPRLRPTLRAFVRGIILGDAQALPGEIAALAAILCGMEQWSILGLSSSAGTRPFVPSDVISRALARALSRRADEDALLIAVK